MADKAKIFVFDKNDTKIDEIAVMFNPAEIGVTTGATVNGTGTGIQFDKVEAEDFTVTLFFDTYEKSQDVRSYTDKITSLVMPTVTGQKTKQPPICLFSWGGFGYRGIIHKVQQRFTMFLSTGIPVRAEVVVTFKSVITKQEDADFRGREACRKFWTIREGDRLDLIAFKALGSPFQWRIIAKANNITKPLLFPEERHIGSTIIIPDTDVI